MRMREKQAETKQSETILIDNTNLKYGDSQNSTSYIQSKNCPVHKTEENIYIYI